MFLVSVVGPNGKHLISLYRIGYLKKNHLIPSKTGGSGGSGHSNVKYCSIDKLN